ncbi:DUF418 domain-containing protein [Psychroserpens burtonensis]|uniref:DUF418 domain-containing protein n=1 Tax=Psychroserpens burtonensis TaxID=49278 RepID=A0A5C7B3L1_9FLAO|nr:DUF418 domain-containing protein [Psychroserpens burtonensis]TXE15332.1 DUF418 domain-containing protein [Psychroserpens burtonensis]
MARETQRILGYDFARGLAIIGMIFVNFKTVMVAETDAYLYQLVALLSGKAAALFVVLAGVGMTLMYRKAKNDAGKIRKAKIILLKRAAFLFIVGLSYYSIWPADILHYYGLYVPIGVLFLSVSRKWLLIISFLLIIAYSASVLFFNYDTGWDWNTLEYTDFFTVNGFFRNLFLNGFHPVFPWIAFLLTGIWIGKLNFNNTKIRKRVTLFSFTLFVVFKSISIFLIDALNQLWLTQASDITHLLGTTPMPPLFFYMITASSLAVFIISISIYICNKLSHTLFIKQMVSTGQLSLSNYFFHVIIGMLAIKLFFKKLEAAFSIEFTVVYAIVFSVVIIFFSHIWRMKFKKGPLEYIMRKITG